MQNVTTWKEKIFVSEMNEWLKNKLAHILINLTTQ